MYRIALATITDDPTTADRLNMLYLSDGYIVDTIEGLTGVESKIDTMPNINAAGESFAGYTIEGKTLTIMGKILDGNTAKKQALLDFVKPARELYLEIYQYDGSSLSRPTLYRKARCVVKCTPIITQTKHSRFGVILSMPYPFFLAAEKEQYTLSMGQGFVNMFGDVEPDYELTFTIPTSSQPIYGITLYHGVGVMGKYLYFDFTKTTAGEATTGDVIKVWRENGRLHCTTNDVNSMEIIYVNSTLWMLPLGTREFYHFSGYVDNASISYYPAYSGVLVDGV